MEEFSGAYSLELDLTNLESNVGKVLYEDETGCRVTVKSMEETTSLGGYKLVFLVKGICAPSGGQPVSGCCDKQVDKLVYSLERLCLHARQYQWHPASPQPLLLPLLPGF